MRYDTALSRAIAAHGGRVKLAKVWGVTPQAVMGWIKQDRVPAIRALDVERETGIPCEVLRPDIYQRGAPNGKDT
jgi:DNA-binding transcriptional regulator YdaS (Cro superfamily)